MSKTLITVGSWRECGKIISSAIANRWSVLHTLLFEDIPAALEKMKVDLILLPGCSSRKGWENAAWRAWAVCQDTPVVALGSNLVQEALINSLTGGPTLVKMNGMKTRREVERAEIPSLNLWTISLRRSELTPTLTLFEPHRSVISYGIERALAYIEAHYAEPISLGDVAASASYSRCHFSKVFKEQLGVCFVSYLAQVRVRHAKELLARTSMSVTNVSLEVGFNDLSHFERVFRAIQHQSPSKFRFKSKEMASGAKNPPSISSHWVASYAPFEGT
jgi:AraC-like DNA-binding protein